jgi:hypothetical protein
MDNLLVLMEEVVFKKKALDKQGKAIRKTTTKTQLTTESNGGSQKKPIVLLPSKPYISSLLF